MKCKCGVTESSNWKKGLCSSCYCKQWRNNNVSRVRQYSESIKDRFGRAQRSAKSRQIEWGLSLEEFSKLCDEPCHYCSNKIGVPVTQGSGLDRINNDKGYVIDNIIPCCGTCNMIKNGSLSFNEMEKVAELIISLRGV